MIAELAVAAAMTMPMAPAPGDGAVVDIPGRLFSPPELVVLAGQQVTWRNDDGATHDVRAADGEFDSGRLVPGASFSHVFAAPGTHAYVCTIHRSMRGTIDVVGLDLRGPEEGVPVGEDAMLDARAPAGSGPVRLERLPDTTPPTPPELVAELQPGDDGRLTFMVPSDAPGRYRARLGSLTSRVVVVRVAPRVTASARRRGRRVVVRARVEPAAAARAVVLQDYVRERFDYLPLARAKLRRDGTATFSVRTSRRLRLRAAVTRPAGRWAPAASAVRVVARRG
jgi:plastocyanin